MVEAFLHIAGAFVAWCAFSALMMYLVVKEGERITKRNVRNAAIALGVPVSAVEQADESLALRVLDYSRQRFSNELLRNRLSDLVGTRRTAWGWFGALLQLGAVVAVCWGMYNEGARMAQFMWYVPAIAVLSTLLSLPVSYLCLLLTGRYPGEAKRARKIIEQTLEQQQYATAAGSEPVLANQV